MKLTTHQITTCKTRCNLLQHARIPCRANLRPKGLACPGLFKARAAPQEVDLGIKSDEEALKFGHLLLAVLDANEYLSTGSKGAISVAAQLMAREAKGLVTVLVVQEQGTTAADPDKQLETITWHLRDKGVPEFSVMQRATEQPASVLIGDVADEVAADIVVISSEAVHAKHLDANQLAEFVACPILVLP